VTEELSYQVGAASGAAVVVVRGGIFLDNRDELMATLLALAGAAPARVVLDLTAVAACDSAGLNMLVRVHLAAAAAGGWLRLVAPTPSVRRVLVATNLDRLLGLYPDTGSALAG
jgi:stage II sporulation protein AA (anti-sigma F factor antagonist)